MTIYVCIVFLKKDRVLSSFTDVFRVPRTWHQVQPTSFVLPSPSCARADHAAICPYLSRVGVTSLARPLLLAFLTRRRLGTRISRALATKPFAS
jgi:hypothetical protein